MISPPGDADTMISNVSKLIDHTELRRQMGEANHKKAVDLFSVDRMVSETEDVIWQLYQSKVRSG